jgi:putative hydrolase of HD superfamily
MLVVATTDVTVQIFMVKDVVASTPPAEHFSTMPVRGCRLALKWIRWLQTLASFCAGWMSSSVQRIQLSADDYCKRFVDPALAVIRSRLLQDRPLNVADYFLDFRDEIRRDIELHSAPATIPLATDAVASPALNRLPHPTSPLRSASNSSATTEVGEIGFINHLTQSNRDDGQQQQQESSAAKMHPLSRCLGPCPPVTSFNPSSVITFLHTCSLLKVTKRTGWLLRGLVDIESVADHSWRMSLMALLLGSSAGIDAQRAMSIAVVHDLAEALVGDIAPGQGVDKAMKQLLEADAMKSIVGQLAAENAALGRHVSELWLEYEGAQTAEALFVKDMDKLEMILQAREYERARGVDLQDFFDGTRGKIVTDVAIALQRALLTERETARSSFVNNGD